MTGAHSDPLTTAFKADSGPNFMVKRFRFGPFAGIWNVTFDGCYVTFIPQRHLVMPQSTIQNKL